MGNQAGLRFSPLARAENRNAITGPEMLSEIIGAIDDAGSDPEVGVLVITGEGPASSAGGNIKEMADRTGLFAGTPRR
jgi:enoyl-CoA hydratase/carnithine racemase